jgi:uncharacterized protein YggE
MRRSLSILVCAFSLAAPVVHSQAIEINRQNRTIEIVVTESVRVAPDLANVTLGCLAYGQTHDAAYQANLAIADKVIKALLGAGVSKDQIESESLQLSETNPEDTKDQTASLRKVKQYKALQDWHIRVPAGDAQKVIDLAVQAGANGIEEVSWEVTDPGALEEKAREAAIEKARVVAADIAKPTGAKVGDLLYASNVLNGILGLLGSRNVSTSSASVGPTGNGFSSPVFSLQLFPQKVQEQATVRAIFAIE